jgi:hypothetical protein
MAVIDFTSFSGEIPKMSPRLLPEGSAATAINCDLESGNLQPMPGVTSDIYALADDIRTIHRRESEFLAFDSIVHVARSFIASSGRLMYTGDEYPKEYDGSDHFRLGIEAPTNALTIHLDGTPSGTIEERSYVYTFVSKRADGSDVESAPSPPTGVTEVSSDIGVSVSGFTTTGMLAGTVISHYRLYRLNAGTTGAEYQYVMELPVSTTGEVEDTVAAADLAEVLPTEDWTAPDADMVGIIATSHGLMFGFVDNTIYASETFIPYAYPSIYSLTVESDIVGLGYTGSMVVVLTRTAPYLLSGQNPDTLELKRLGYPEPCVSARSIVNIPGGVVYAAPDGLFMIDEVGSGQMLTRSLFTRAQWGALTPADIIGFYYDDSYLCFFDGAATGFQLGLTSGAYSAFALAEPVYGGMYSPEDDELYLIQDDGAARSVVSWKTGADMTYIWTSKIFSYPFLQTLTAGMIQGTFGTTDITLYVDGVAQTPITVTSDTVFRIPPVLGSEFQIKLEGDAVIDRVILGGSAAEVSLA